MTYSYFFLSQYSYSKTCVKQPLLKRPKIGFKDQLSLNAGQKYCRMLQGWSILQYFRPSLSYQLFLGSLFCLFLSSCFTQVLLFLITFEWQHGEIDKETYCLVNTYINLGICLVRPEGLLCAIWVVKAL